jgi:hypothetical protein
MDRPRLAKFLLSLKKKQTRRIYGGKAVRPQTRLKEAKVFCFFFSKKKILA